MTEEESKQYTKIVILSILGGIAFTTIWANYYFNYSIVILSIVVTHTFAFITSKRFERHIWSVLVWGIIAFLVYQNKELGLVTKTIVTLGIGIQVGILILFLCSEVNQKRKKKSTEPEDRLNL